MWLRGSSTAAFRHLLRDRRGVTAVEFGLVGLIFFVLLLGAMEMARFQFMQQSLRDAAGEAVRAALIQANLATAECYATQPPNACPPSPPTSLPADVEAFVKSRTPFLDPDLLSFTFESDDAGNGVRTIRAIASYQFHFLFLPVPGWPSGLLAPTNVAALSY